MQKKLSEIKSAPQSFVQELVLASGFPSYVVEAAEGSFFNMPDVDSDPEAARAMKQIEDDVDALSILSQEPEEF